MRPPALVLALAVPILAAGPACRSAEDRAARERLFSAGDSRRAPAPFDWSRPESALGLSADDVAARLGSFEWTAAVTWTVAKPKAQATVHATERHRVQQSASGEFAVDTRIDPEDGPGSDRGKHVVWAGGMTYAEGLYPPFGGFRERPTDRGRDARRFRDEAFGMAAEMAGLCDGGLRLEPRGETTVLHRPARRFRVTLDAAAASARPSRLGGQPPAGGPDPDTRKRLAFLDGRMPVKADGELVLDAETGAPLEVKLRGVFQTRDDPDVRVDVDLAAQMRAVGDAVPAVAAPKRALPDERKPKGVARALEAAGLKKAREAGEGGEPGDEPE